MVHNPFAESYERYMAAGWAVVPILLGTKRPAASGCTGWNGVDLTAEQAARWADGETEYAIGLRMPPDVIAIDVDAYEGKNGAETLRRLEEECGPLPASFRNSARADAVSGHRFYRVGLEPNALIGDFGKDSGIEIISRHCRTAVVWPTVHPKLVVEYKWWSADGTERDIPNVEEVPLLCANGARN